MNFVEALGRVFLSTLFLYESVRKYFYQFETIEYMENFGVPEFLFYPSLIFELIIPILLIIGFKTRIAAAAMFIFTLLVSIIFHSDFTNNMQIMAFLKNLSISGGFLIIASYEAKKFTLDYYLKYKKLK
jgi:putative oxidoreductase|tara:strand:+ start:116 stop:502 length:387 start_codon:yes stop_codon:yes gene_type:complete